MKKQTLSEILRDALRNHPQTPLEIERQTGIHRASICRFINGERSLRLDRADALINFLGIECKPPRAEGK